jgi:hypothetical protein
MGYRNSAEISANPARGGELISIEFICTVFVSEKFDGGNVVECRCDGPEESRTPDLRVSNSALCRGLDPVKNLTHSPLSYRPTLDKNCKVTVLTGNGALGRIAT